ncbi:MAG: hypothetical protein DWQ01_03880 [Planctomycetota bacterium]|nr:MAG: hypothetical protein DWQ01_03880 [Planctomycetota bacterium]
MGAALAAWLLYFPILQADFVYDDKILLQDNLFIRSWDALWKSFTLPYWEMISERRYAAGYYRPLGTVMYTLLWHGGGGEAWIFHAASLLLHSATVMTLVLLAGRLGFPPMVAGAAGLYFALHGAQIQTVAWASASTYLLATWLSLMAVRAYLADKPASMALWLLPAMLAQEMAFGVAALLLASILWTWTGKRKSAAWLLLPAAVVCGLRVLAFDHWTAGFAQPSNFAILGFSFGEQLAISLSLVAKYLGFLFWPWPHAPFRPLRLDYGAASLERGLPALLGLLLLIAGAIWWLKQSRRSPAKGIACGLLLFPLLTVLNLGSLGQFPFEERFLYLPAAGFCLGLAAVAAGLFANRESSPQRIRIATAVLLLLALLQGAFAWNPVSHWQNEEAFYRWARQSSPNAVMSYLGQAGLLQQQVQEMPADDPRRQQKLDNAMYVLRQAQDIDRRKYYVTPTDWNLLHAAVGNTLVLGGEARLAFDFYEALLMHDPLAPENNHGMATALGTQALQDLAQGRLEQARDGFQKALGYYEKALAGDPSLASAWLGKGNCLVNLGKVQEGLPFLEKAYSLEPDDEVVLLNLVRVFGQTGRFQKAGQFLREFLDRHPGDPEVSLELGKLHSMQGEEWLAQGKTEEGLASFRRSIPYFETCLEADPYHPEALLGLGRALAFQREFQKALPLLQKAFMIAPEDERQAMVLASVYVELGQWETAAQVLEEHLANQPNSPRKAEMEAQIKALREAAQ